MMKAAESGRTDIAKVWPIKNGCVAVAYAGNEC